MCENNKFARRVWEQNGLKKAILLERLGGVFRSLVCSARRHKSGTDEAGKGQISLGLIGQDEIFRFHSERKLNSEQKTSLETTRQ